LQLKHIVAAVVFPNAPAGHLAQADSKVTFENKPCVQDEQDVLA
jgi:hypothetical protein